MVRSFPNRLLNPTLIALVVLTALWALFFWRLLTPAQVDRVIFPEGDFTQHYYAFSAYQVERLAQGEFPLWNPYNHSGDPFAANIQFVAFYPPRLLMAAAFGADWSLEDYQLEVALHYWLASLMMFAFLRVLLNRPGVALAGSILYTYGGYLVGYPMLQVSVLESVVWLPLILLGVHLAATRPGVRWLAWGSALGGVGVALSLLGGHPQTTMQLTYFALAYLAFQAIIQKRSVFWFVLRAALFGSIGVGLAMIQLLPAAEFTRLSYRVTQLGFEDKANGFVASDFLQVVWPWLFGVWSPLYVGVAGFVLAVGAMLRPKAHLFWLLTLALGIFLSMGGNSIVYDLFYIAVPGFSIFRQQERVAALMSFALVVLACMQMVWLMERTDPRRERWFVRGAAAYVGLLVLVYVVGTVVTLLQSGAASDAPASATSVFGFVAVIGVLVIGWLVWQGQYQGARWHILVPLILLVVVDVFTVGTRSENFLPDTPENRVTLLPALRDLQTPPDAVAWRVDGAAGLQGNGVLFSVPDIYGTGPFSLATIEELRRIPVDRFWEVLAVRYVTAIDEPPVAVVPMELLAYDVNYTGEEYRLFELVDPRPMAHLVYDYRDAQNSAEFARQIMADNRVNLREMAVTLTPLPFELPGARPDLAEVRDYQSTTPEDITMTVSTSENALLTVAIVNYPGWRAAVNGEQVEIVDTYAGLIGIPIPAGENQQVRLTFAPQSVQLGALLTLITGIGIVVLCVGAWWLGRRTAVLSQS
ncbi:MAG: hypothetical protein OHK0046_35100 [Anaerolineae bacterium]